MFLCVLKLGTPINITMPSASLTPKQCTLTEADISAESSLQHFLDEKKIIAECYKELRVQILERAAEYSKKIDNTTVPTVDNEASSQRYLTLCTRTVLTRASNAQAVHQRTDQLYPEQDLRLVIAQSQAAASAPRVVAGASATGTPVQSRPLKPKTDFKPAKLSRNSTLLELNIRIQAYTAYASASNFKAIPCLEENLQEYVSSKTDNTVAVFGNNGINVIKKRFKVKYPLFTKRLQYYYEQRKERSYSEFHAQLQQLQQEAIFNDEIDAAALKEETFRSMFNACKRGAREASAIPAESRGSGDRRSQSPGSLNRICKTWGREPHQEDELCPAQKKKCIHCKETGHFARIPEGIIICPANRQPWPQRWGGNGYGSRSHGGKGDHGPDRGDGDNGEGNSHARAAVGGDEDEDNGHSNQDQVHASANQVYECYLVGNQQENNEEFQPAPTRAGGVDHA